jgi:acetolactate synthase I/II/III large subunit
MPTGAELLIDQLIALGATRAFGVPGESYLAALDAMSARANAFSFVTCRQEGGAAFMAEADGKLTGAPGLCFVTRGPGATNASIGVHTAMQDSTPMILFIGQVATSDIEREAFQEIDYRRMFGSLAKWAAQIDHAHRVPEMVARAWHVATSGRPGPVVLALPEDMLSAAAEAAIVEPRAFVPGGVAFSGAIEDVVAGLAKAERPLVLLGGPGWTENAFEAARLFAEAWDLPVATAFRAKDKFDNAHPSYAGDCGIGAAAYLEKAIAESDLLFVIGARLDEMTTNAWARLASPLAAQRLVHVHVSAGELNKVTRADFAFQGSPLSFLDEMNRLTGLRNAAPVRRESRAVLRAAYEAFIAPVSPPGAVNPSAIFNALRERLPHDTIMTNGAGNYAGWLHRFWLHRRLGTQLAPQSGAMGYGTPAAIAAKLRFPERIVIANAGDGCFLMNGQELATAVQHNAAIVILVWDNGSYGTIRMHQEREFPGRVSGTDLKNPDFAALARAYGAAGFSVNRTEDFAAAFDAALAANRPALIHIKTDVEAITPAATLSAIRAKALETTS